MIFFGADNKKVVADAMGALRLKLGKDLNLTDESKWAPLWVIDFPMFEDDGEGGLTAMHHPFTSPKDMTAAELKAAPEEAVANAYDMVINGYEVGGGSVRIHSGEMQQTVFGILGHQRTGAAREVWLPAGRPEVRYPSARGSGFRS